MLWSNTQFAVSTPPVAPPSKVGDRNEARPLAREKGQTEVRGERGVKQDVRPAPIAMANVSPAMSKVSASAVDVEASVNPMKGVRRLLFD